MPPTTPIADESDELRKKTEINPKPTLAPAPWALRKPMICASLHRFFFIGRSPSGQFTGNALTFLITLAGIRSGSIEGLTRIHFQRFTAGSGSVLLCLVVDFSSKIAHIRSSSVSMLLINSVISPEMLCSEDRR
jgi:hypothetical protein